MGRTESVSTSSELGMHWEVKIFVFGISFDF
jgi:hypothetical protein